MPRWRNGAFLQFNGKKLPPIKIPGRAPGAGAAGVDPVAGAELGDVGLAAEAGAAAGAAEVGGTAAGGTRLGGSWGKPMLWNTSGATVLSLSIPCWICMMACKQVCYDKHVMSNSLGMTKK